MLVDGQVDLDPASANELDLVSGPRAESPGGGHQISVLESADAIDIDTGAARFRVRAGGGFPFDDLVVHGQSGLDVSRSALNIVDGAGGICRASITRVALEDRGSLRTSVLMTGTIARASGDEHLSLTARLHFFAGLASVRLLITLTNRNRALHKGGFWDLGDPGSVLVKDVSLSLALPTADGPVTVHCSREPGDAWQKYDAPFELYQDSSGGENWKSPNHLNRLREIPNAFRGYRLRSGDKIHPEGLRASPIVEVRQGTRHIVVTLPHFWQNFPKAIEVSGSTLTLGLFPRQYSDLHEIQGGEQKTHECFLSFANDGVTDEPLGWCRARAVASADPDWCRSTEAIPFLASFDADHQALVNAAVDGADRFELKREVIDEYGWRHFGEIYGDHEAVRHQGPAPLVSHCNNFFDPIAGFAYQFLLTADPRWRQLLTELAAHVVDIDIYHTTRDRAAYNHGQFWHTYHYGDADTATHRTYPRIARGHIHGGGPSADSLYTTGLMLHYFLTGDEASRQTVIDAAAFIIDIDDGRKSRFRWIDRGDTGAAALSAPGYYGPGRSAANSLESLMNAYRLSGDARFIDYANKLIRRVIHPHDDIGARGLDAPDQRWFYTMFLQALGKYLHDKVASDELDEMYGYARASVLHYARWMAEHEYPYLDKPEKLQFPTETWAAHETRKSDVFYLAARFATEGERARFLERGAFFFRAAIDTLQRMPTRSLARPVIILSTSGRLHSWTRAHQDSQAPVPAMVEYGRPQKFVPQRARAKRRAAALGIVALGISAAALDVGRVVDVLKGFVPGSLSFLFLALSSGALTMVVWKRGRRIVRGSLLALALTYLVLACPWTAHRLASGLIDGAAAAPIEAGSRTAVAVLEGDHGFARIQEAARLYHQLHPRWLIVSGDAEFRDELIRADVPEERLLWDDHPVSTRQQALNLRRLVDEHGIDDVILVASPLHMPRAQRACEAAGVHVRPSPSTLPHLRLPRSGLRSFIPSREALRFSWETLYEYLGLVYYRARGWLTLPH
jgi:uncharacterized SAM-binding protein YcdF (DUF218 family)